MKKMYTPLQIAGMEIKNRTFMAPDELPVPLIVMIKFRGSVSDVQAALEAAKAKAEQLAGVVNEYEIARPTEDTEKMLKISAFDKGTPHKINKEEIEEI